MFATQPPPTKIFAEESGLLEYQRLAFDINEL
jgi:hypothetical protein